jgi:energy-coupling factor transporter ATP-binding protein EcfA2
MTGSGKSTFINYMMDVLFNYEEKRSNYILTPTDQNSNQARPKIGHTKTSCTEVPEVYESNGIIWHDPAGFLDTKGIEQEILNAYCNAKMFKRGSRARIILVV